MKKTRVWLSLAALLATVLIAGPSWLGCEGGIGPGGQITVPEDADIRLEEGEVAPIPGVPPGELPPGVVPPVRNMLVVTLDGVGTVTSNPAGINCAADCDEAYNVGTSVDLTAATNALNKFDSWSGDCTGTGTCSVNMDSNKTVTAKFVPKDTYLLEINLLGNGSVAYDGITCILSDPTSCRHGYIEAIPSTVVNLAATADAGYTFDSWGGACSGSGLCSVTMDANKTVEANFGPATPSDKTLDLKFKGLGSGNVTAVTPEGTSSLCLTDCSSAFPDGQELTLTATADEGTFYQWEDDCSGLVCELVMDDDKEVTANFKGPAPEIVPPTMPAVDAREVPVKETLIKATFSQPMLESSISDATFLLTKGNGDSVDGDVDYNETDETVVFDPDSDLYAMRIYEAKLTTGIQNIEETPMSADYIWNFRTVDAKWMPPFALDKSYHEASEAMVVADNSGYFAAIWKQFVDDSKKGIYVNSYKLNRNWAVSPAPMLLDSGSVSMPRVAVNKNGKGFVSWAKKDSTVNKDIYIYKYDITLNRTIRIDESLSYEPPVKVLPAPIHFAALKEYNLIAECTTSSNALAAWVQREGGHDVLYARYIQASDLSMGPAKRLSSLTNEASDIQLAADCEGNIYIAWVEKISGKSNVNVARIGEGFFEGPVQMNASGSDALEPEVSVRSDGELAIVVWKEKGPAIDAIYHIQSKMYRSTSGWDSTSVQIDNATSTINFASTPMVAMSYNGDVVVAYKQGHAARWSLNARLYHVRGTPGWGDYVEIAPEMSHLGNYVVGMDNKSNAIIAWRQRVSEPLVPEEGGDHYNFGVIYAKRHLYCTLDSCNKDEWDASVKVTRANRSEYDIGVDLIKDLRLAVSEGRRNAFLIWNLFEKEGTVQTHSIYGSQFDIGIGPALRIDMGVPRVKPLKIPGLGPPTDIIGPPPIPDM